MKFPFEKVVFDGGTIIELLLSGEDSELFKSILEGEVIPLTTTLAIIEAEYVLCRKIGKDTAFQKVDDLLDSKYFMVISIETFSREISTLKCLNPIAIPDCATIALAIKTDVPALFAKKERELDKQLEKKPFEIKVYFLEDLN